MLTEDYLCTIPSLKAFLPKSNNVNLVVRSLLCDSDEAKTDYLKLFSITYFNNDCVVDKSQVIVHVNSPDFHFNITKSAKF